MSSIATICNSLAIPCGSDVASTGKKGTPEYRAASFEHPLFETLPAESASLEKVVAYFSAIRGISGAAAYKEVLEFCGAAEKTRLANAARPKDEVVSARKVNSELADIFSNYENESEETKALMRQLAAIQGKDLEALVAARNGK